MLNDYPIQVDLDEVKRKRKAAAKARLAERVARYVEMKGKGYTPVKIAMELGFTSVGTLDRMKCDARKAGLLPAIPEMVHGGEYPVAGIAGCKCGPCRAKKNEYSKKRKARIRAEKKRSGGRG